MFYKLNFGESDAKINHENRISTLEEIAIPNPNDQYDFRDLGTLSTEQEVDSFFNEHNHDNNYNGLKVGQTITISNCKWKIAGFDLEYNQTAQDGTVYNNGYGICMIPKDYTPYSSFTKFFSNNDEKPLGYLGSYIHDYINTGHVGINIKRGFYDHVVNRNVLLSNATGSTGYSTSYIWTTAYSTLMSPKQVIGEESYYFDYDIGEANYKLPLFTWESIDISSNYWLRGLCSWYNGRGGVLGVYGSSITAFDGSGNAYAIRPLIYAR